MLRHYWPLLRLVFLLVFCIVLIVFTIRAFTNNLKEAQSPDTDPALSENSEEQPGSAEGSEEQPGSDSQESGNDAAVQPPSLPQATEEAVNAQIEEADFIAAGYDYQGAIDLLKEVDGWESIQAIQDKISEYEELDSQLVVYQDMSSITHIFFHSLVVDNDRAFDGDATQDGYNLYMTTIPEFNAILDSLYEKGYVLVSPYDVAGEITDENGTHFGYREIRLPEGKKPFMMSQDDINYYGYMIGGTDGSGDTPVYANTNGDGFASRICHRGGRLSHLRIHGRGRQCDHRRL